MNRIILIAFLALAIPQITFAAWWNPLSWSIFHRGQNSSEISRDALLKQYSPKEIEPSQTVSSDDKALLEPSDINKYIDILIAEQKKNLDMVNAVLRNIDVYTADFNEGKSLSLDAKNHARSGFDGAWNFVISLWDKELEQNQWNKDLFNKMKSTIQGFVSDLEKRMFYTPLTPQQYVSEFENLKKHHDSILKDRQLILNQYNSFETRAKEKHSEIGSYMLFVLGKELEYDKSDLDNYRSLQADYDSTYQRPIVVPQIQMPKTTNCSMREMAGAKGIISISCDTY